MAHASRRDHQIGEHMRIYRIQIGALLILCGACLGPDRQPHSAAPTASPLVVVAGGRDVRRIDEYDGTLRYMVDDPFPASILRDGLSQVLERDLGWTPSEETLLSLVAGEPPNADWFHFEDKSGLRVSQLAKAWRNTQGDLVTYILRYEVLPDTNLRGTVHVTGVLTRVATVERLRKKAF